MMSELLNFPVNMTLKGSEEVTKEFIVSLADWRQIKIKAENGKFILYHPRGTEHGVQLGKDYGNPLVFLAIFAEGLLHQDATIVALRSELSQLRKERNAWREDADWFANWMMSQFTSIEHVLLYEYHKEDRLALDHHSQLHERYPTEKSESDKGE